MNKRIERRNALGAGTDNRSGTFFKAHKHGLHAAELEEFVIIYIRFRHIDKCHKPFFCIQHHVNAFAIGSRAVLDHADDLGLHGCGVYREAGKERLDITDGLYA